MGYLSGHMAASKHLSDLIYPLTLTPCPMGTINGLFAKTNKAQVMNYLIKDADHAQLTGPSVHRRCDFGGTTTLDTVEP